MASLIASILTPWAAAQDPGTVQRAIESTLPRLPGPAVQGSGADRAHPAANDADKVLGEVQAYALETSLALAPALRSELNARLLRYIRRPIRASEVQALQGHLTQLFQTQLGYLAVVQVTTRPLTGANSPQALELHVQLLSPLVRDVSLSPQGSPSAQATAAVTQAMQDLVVIGQPLDTLALDNRLAELAERFQVDLPVDISAWTGAGGEGIEVAVSFLPRATAVDTLRAQGGQISANNYGSQSYGRGQVFWSHQAEGFTPGDSVALQALVSQGVNYLRAAYVAPSPSLGWSTTLWASHTHTQTVPSIATVSVGHLESAGLILARSHYVARDVVWNSHVALTRQDADSTSNGLATDHRKLYSLTLEQEWGRGVRDDFAFGDSLRSAYPLRQSRWLVSGQYTSGKLDMSGNAGSLALDQVSGGLRKNGYYAKWNLQASSAWQPATHWPVALEGQWRMQRANRNLDSLEKFALGGPTGLRAYAYGDATGDEGAALTLSLRWAVAPNLWLAPFAERGWIRTNAYSNDDSPTNTYRLADAGLSGAWAISRALRTDVALARSWRVQDLPTSQTQNMEHPPGRWRGWVSLSWLY